MKLKVHLVELVNRIEWIKHDKNDDKTPHEHDKSHSNLETQNMKLVKANIYNKFRKSTAIVHIICKFSMTEMNYSFCNPNDEIQFLRNILFYSLMYN